MKVKIGDRATITKIFTKYDVLHFADLSLDFNPLHLDDDYAKSTSFKKPIIHGMLIASLMSAVISSKLPGKGSIYLSQNLKFEAPVYIDDAVTAEVEIIAIQKKRIITLNTICKNQNELIVISGQAVVMKSEL